MSRNQPEHNQPELGAQGGGAGSNLPPLKDVVAAPGGYARALGRNLKERLSEPGQRGPTIFLLVLVAGVLLGAVYLAAIMVRVPDVEGLASARNSQATVVFSEDGVQLARYYRENRTWVPMDSIAPIVSRALIDTEDRRFYNHWGIDVKRTIGAIFKTVTGDMQGGSTITMQLVRNAYPEIGDDFAITRKFEEWFTALQIERHYDKEEILEIYLNTVPFNYNAFGVEAAAQTYYNRSALRLDTLQAAMLVGMLKGTTLYNPVRNPEQALERRGVVLQLMRDAGTLDAAAYERLKGQGLQLDFNPVTSEKNRAPYFAEYVRNWLKEWAEGEDLDIYEDGLRVYTTIDAGLQANAEAAVREEVEQLQDVVDVAWGRRSLFVSGDPGAYRARRDDVTPFAYFWESNPEVLPAFLKQTDAFKQRVEAGASEEEVLAQLGRDEAFVDSVKTAMTRLQAGFVAIDPDNGHIRAWVGGSNFEENKYDHVALSKRQPGSTFKPFVYAAALQKGYSPNDYLRDEKVEYVDPVTKQRWEPGNFGRESGDLYSLREGLAHSKNTITAQLILDVGPEKVAELAHRAGVESDLDAVPSLGLGTSVVTLLELVSAYVPFVEQGRYHKPLFVTRIEDAQGQVLATFESETREALDPAVAYGTLDMLRGVVREGTGVRIGAQYGGRGDLAGKTGTTQNAADTWFVLLHPDLVMGSWIGFPSPAVTFRSEYWGQGSHTALRIVGHFYRDAALPANARFAAPAGYAAPAGDGRLLVVRGDADDPRLEERSAREAERLDRVRDRDGDGTRTDELNLAELESDAARDEASEEGRSDRDEGQEGEGQEGEGQEGEGQEGGEDAGASQSRTEELNEQARKNSQVQEYLERLRKEKEDDDD